jgi:ligand-binding sensor domain-containing protein/serine phosphatase RsbU (regulator of sigma subunit)
MAEGICHPFVYSVNQDINGFLWASVGTGLCRYDGFSFSQAGSDTLTEAYAGVSFKDNKGLLWFGHSNGDISYYDGKTFKIINQSGSGTSSINGFVQDKKGNILAITQSNGLIRIKPNKKVENLSQPFEGKLCYAITLTSRNEIMIGTDNGIFIYTYSDKLESIKEIGSVEQIPPTKIQVIYKAGVKDIFYVGTEDEGIYKLVPNEGKPGFKIDNLGKTLGIEQENVQSVFRDSENNLWISTFGKGLIKVIVKENGSFKDVIHYNSANGLGIDFVKNVFQDREGNIWVSTYGNGLAALVDESFTFFDYQKLIGKNILSVAFHPDGYFLGGEKSILKVTNGLKKETTVIGAGSGLPVDQVKALLYSDNGTLWIGTNKNGVYMLLPGRTVVSQFFRADNSLGNSVSSLAVSGNDLYIGTKNGVYQINYLNKNLEHYGTSEGLPHNNIHQVFTDSKNNILVATKSNSLFSLNGNVNYKLDGNVEIEYTCIAEDYEGNIWAGTNGSGVFKFSKNDFKYFSVKTTGLKSDYCYAMTTDNSGNVWVGHRLGLSRINVKNELVKIYGPEAGIDGDINENAIVDSKNGKLLFGTTSGLIHYESSKVNNRKLPPIVNITSVQISDKEYDFSERIVLPYSIYKMKIDFIGLNYSNPEQVTYRYMLEGFDIDWSEPSTSRTAIYSRLTDGDYTFQLKASNSDGQWNEEPLLLQIRIKKPFWKTWWFITMMVIALIVGVYMIIVIRERKQKEFQIYLEKMLDDRTKEVREQKEEIEIKNRDITDSINYAQRIQASILPSVRKLQQYFTGSFVYYAPRDIVSGDFYWFDQLPGTNKFIIVCADSTGHGVPGAFMSMIGTTLIKDICNRIDVKSPADILNILDNEIKATLNQNLEGERPNDGMDIIVVELDVATNRMRCSSAMRPFIVYQNGEQLYFKGSRNSIGGQVREEKIFETVELQLTKGDIIYMFSDGYPDQFGGPHGKKFKMVRLRNLLKDIYEKPMEEQYNYVKSNFELWRGELSQVDDVLFMGIRI